MVVPLENHWFPVFSAGAVDVDPAEAKPRLVKVAPPKDNYGRKYERIHISPENSASLTEGGTLERQLATAAYWIGILCTVVAIITRGLALIGIFAFSNAPVSGRNPLSYRTFLEGAVLFFVMAAASGIVALAKERKA